MSYTILHGNSLELLRSMVTPRGLAHCIVTSPPYWGLRNYEVAESMWGDGWRGCLGAEVDPDHYVTHLVEIIEAARPVLRKDGTLWLNIGDSYTAEKRKVDRRHVPGVKQKNLLLIPARVALALQKLGWYVRCDVVWDKPNSRPEQSGDRPTRTHEALFLLARHHTYYYDAEAIREPLTDPGRALRKRSGKTAMEAQATLRPRGNLGGVGVNLDGRNRRSVWKIATQRYDGLHYATFPPRLVEPCIRAGTSERGCCAACGAPWRRQLERTRTIDGVPVDKLPPIQSTSKSEPSRGGGIGHDRMEVIRRTIGWAPSCKCDAGEPVPCRVLDPFNGHGTTGLVATRLRRDYLGMEINAQYVADSIARIDGDAPLFHARRARGTPESAPEVLTQLTLESK